MPWLGTTQDQPSAAGRRNRQFIRARLVATKPWWVCFTIVMVVGVVARAGPDPLPTEQERPTGRRFNDETSQCRPDATSAINALGEPAKRIEPALGQSAPIPLRPDPIFVDRNEGVRNEPMRKSPALAQPLPPSIIMSQSRSAPTDQPRRRNFSPAQTKRKQRKVGSVLNQKARPILRPSVKFSQADPPVRNRRLDTTSEDTSGTASRLPSINDPRQFVPLSSLPEVTPRELTQRSTSELRQYLYPAGQPQPTEFAPTESAPTESAPTHSEARRPEPPEFEMRLVPPKVNLNRKKVPEMEAPTSLLKGGQSVFTGEDVWASFETERPERRTEVVPTAFDTLRTIQQTEPRSQTGLMKMDWSGRFRGE
jgi:hypothetical protein